MWWEKIFAISKRTGINKIKGWVLGEMTNFKMFPDPFLKQQGELKKTVDRFFSKLSDKAFFSWSQKM